MRFPRHWALARSGPAVTWGWSDVSLADAQAEATRRAAELSSRLRLQRPSRHDGYYPDRPIREEVLREVAYDGAALTVAVTRNAAGAEVLNAARALFVDVDLPAQASPGFFARLFGAKAPGGGASAGEVAVVARAVAWAAAHPSWGWRIYRTAAGLRLLATHATFLPDDEAAQAVFRHLGADPLYVRLCLSQDCFRARLTPKPWRVGIPTAPPRWPWADAAGATGFAAWDRAYREAAAGFATCALVRVAGNETVHPDLRAIVALHDEACKVGSGLPLA